MSDDVTAIEGLLHRLSDAWNAGDADAYGEIFTDDATYVTVIGTVSNGRAEITQVHRWLFENALKGSTMTDGGKTDREIRFLTPDVAVVVGTGGGSTLPGQEFTPERASVVSFVAVRDGDGWRFAHFQNTRVTPMPGMN